MQKDKNQDNEQSIKKSKMPDSFCIIFIAVEAFYDKTLFFSVGKPSRHLILISGLLIT